MAFDHADTDLLYEKQIEPVLRKNGVIPIIINRRQSNDDLNNQIIRQLKICDFCVADLTYTRPSVYFEAGFAERSVEVIYTARKDHLDRGAPEDRRVHFDLQMKPLITWSTATDRTFGIRLEKRLRATVLRDWRFKQREIEIKEKEKLRFASLTVSERLVVIRRKSISMFKDIGFGKWMGKYKSEYKYKNRDILSGKINYLWSNRVVGKTLEIVSVQSFGSVTKAYLEGLKILYPTWSLESQISKEKSGIERVKAFHLVVSLQSIPTYRVESVFRDLGRGLLPGQFVRSETLTPFRYQDDFRKVKFVQDWRFIGPIDSQRELLERLSAIRACFEKRQSSLLA